MFKATLKSLLSRKLRLLLSGLAVVLGVMAVSGALVLADSLGRSFDALFQTIDANIDVSVIAAEEAADLILVGSRERGWPRRGLESRLAAQLETETPVPILIAPPRTRPGRRSVAMNGAAR